MNALGTFNLRHVSKGKTTNQKFIEKSPSFSGIFPFISYIEHLGDGKINSKMVHNRVLLIPRIYFLYKGKLSSTFFFRISTWFSYNLNIGWIRNVYYPFKVTWYMVMWVTKQLPFPCRSVLVFDILILKPQRTFIMLQTHWLNSDWLKYCFSYFYY